MQDLLHWLRVRLETGGAGNVAAVPIHNGPRAFSGPQESVRALWQRHSGTEEEGQNEVPSDGQCFTNSAHHPFLKPELGFSPLDHFSDHQPFKFFF